MKRSEIRKGLFGFLARHPMELNQALPGAHFDDRTGEIEIPGSPTFALCVLDWKYGRPQLYISEIDHKHGVDLAVGDSEKAIRHHHQAAYAKVFWEEEVPAEERPKDPEELLARFINEAEGTFFRCASHGLMTLDND